MTSHVERDWLDRLAHRALGGRAPAAPEREAPPSPEEQLSRSAAVKLAAVGVASLSLSLWRAPEGRAETVQECIDKSYDTYGAKLKRDQAACENVYGQGNNVFNSKPGWARVEKLFTKSPWEWVTDYVKWGLRDDCMVRAEKRAFEDLDAAEKFCKDTCSRATQSASRRTNACEPPPPPKSEPPEVPPPPNPGSGLCKPDCQYCCPWGCADPPYIPSGPGADESCDIWKRNCLGNCH